MKKLVVLFVSLCLFYSSRAQDNLDLNDYYFYESVTESVREFRTYEENLENINPIYYESLVEKAMVKQVMESVDFQENIRTEHLLQSISYPDRELELPSKIVVTETEATAYDAQNNIIGVEPIIQNTDEVSDAILKTAYLEGLFHSETAPYEVTPNIVSEYTDAGFEHVVMDDVTHSFSNSEIEITYSAIDESIQLTTFDSEGNIISQNTDYYASPLEGVYRPIYSATKTWGVDYFGLQYHDHKLIHYTNYFIYRSPQLLEQMESEGDVYVAPNPVTSTFAIHHTTVSEFNFEEVVLLNSTTGEVVDSWVGNFDSGSQFDIEGYPDGVYILMIDNAFQTMLIID